MKELFFVPMYEPAADLFPISMDLRTLDSAGSNLACERKRQEDAPASWLLLLPCHVHILHNIQSRVYTVIAPQISGMISFALAQRPAGAVRTLRRAMAHILRQSVRAYPTEPPGPFDPKVTYRDAVFSLCLPQDTQRERRRLQQLRAVLNGDLQQEQVIFCHGLTEVDLDAWAESTANLLLPSGTPIFPRHRWLTSLKAVQSTVLLSLVHNLFVRAVPLWLHMLHGGSIMSYRIPAHRYLWDPETMDDEQEPQGLHAGPTEGSNGADWTEFNARQRTNVAKLTLGKGPGGSLTIAAIIVQPQLVFIAALLKLSSPEHHDWRLSEAVQGKHRWSSLVEWYSGRRLQRHSEKVWEYCPRPNTMRHCLIPRGRRRTRAWHQPGA